MNILEEKKREARKDHICNWCSGIIKTGELYEYQKNVFDGDVYEWKAHIHCLEIVSRYDMNDDGEGVSEQDFSDNVYELYAELISCDCKDLTLTQMAIELFELEAD